jgi:uncharacterized protein (TIGR03437 family)
VNGASFQAALSSNGFVSLFGQNFQTSGRTRSAGLGDFVNGGFPTALGCVSVQATGPGLPQPVLLPILYVQFDQINAQLPAFTGTGPVTLKVILNPGAPNELSGDVATLNSLQAFAPAFLLFSNSNIAAQFAGTAEVVGRPSVIPGARPARPGEIVTLYGTGFGETTPPVTAGQLATSAARVTAPVTLTIGGTTVVPDYVGLSPGSISGLYQLNVKIPESTPPGDVSVRALIGGVESPAGATVPVQ